MKKVIVSMMMVIAMVFAFCACGETSQTSADETTVPESDVLVEEPTTEAEAPEYTTDDVIDMVTQAWEEEGLDGTWKFENYEGIDVFVYYPDGTDNDGVTPFMVYYAENGVDSNFTKYWTEGIVPNFMNFAQIVYDATGEDYPVAIANPFNTDNVILIVDRNQTIYDAFNE